MNVRFCILLLALVVGIRGNAWAGHEMQGSDQAKQETTHQHSGDEQAHSQGEAHGGTTSQKTETMKSSSVVYTCPMHPEVQEEKPGQCPKCGMNLEVMHGMHEGMQQMQNPHAEHVATLREAANALKETNPGLSAKLETMAKNMSQ